jgi:hypothetical protein
MAFVSLSIRQACRAKVLNSKSIHVTLRLALDWHHAGSCAHLVGDGFTAIHWLTQGADPKLYRYMFRPTILRLGLASSTLTLFVDAHNCLF